MDLEALSKNITIDTSASQEIAELCNKLLDIQKEVTTLEDQLKKKKAEELGVELIKETDKTILWCKDTCIEN